MLDLDAGKGRQVIKCIQLHLQLRVLQCCKEIGFVCLSSVVIAVVVTKITRSGVLSICSCCNYHELVDIGEKLVSVHFELLNMAH